MNTPTPENYDNIDEARALVETALVVAPQTAVFVR